MRKHYCKICGEEVDYKGTGTPKNKCNNCISEDIAAKKNKVHKYICELCGIEYQTVGKPHTPNRKWCNDCVKKINSKKVRSWEERNKERHKLYQMRHLIKRKGINPDEVLPLD